MNDENDGQGNDACVFLMNDGVQGEDVSADRDVRSVWIWIGANVSVIDIVTHVLFSMVAPETR
jgi:hypothetical protein